MDPTAHPVRAHGLRRRAAAARLAVAAALLSGGAAVLHAAAAGPHLAHYAPFGILFVATAVLQGGWAVIVLVSQSPRTLAAGAVGNAGVVAAWALSRTAGLPVGPEAWTAEPVTPLDGAATAFELAIVAACVVLLHARAGARLPLEAWRFAAVGAVVVAGLTAAPLAVGGAGHHHHNDGTAAHPAAGHVHAAGAPAQTIARPRPERVRAAQSSRNGAAERRRTAAKAAHDHASHPHDHASHPHEHP